jgi:RNA 2',3'-cyclic 3'-phosphodiesterase
MTDETIRTFIAVEIPRTLRDQIEEALAPVRRHWFGLADSSRGDRSSSPIQWAQPSGWHVTMKFLGDLTARQVEQVTEIAGEVAAGSTPFEAAIGDWGAFPRPDRPRIIFVGIDQGRVPLAAVANRLERALAIERYEPDDRDFHPHITVARVKNPRQGAEAFTALRAKPVDGAAFMVDRLVVFRSKLTRRGARYEPLAECPFGG